MADEWKKIKISYRNSDTECYINVPFLTPDGKMEAPLTIGDAMSALRKAGVVRGLRQDRLKQLFDEGLFDQEVLVAESTPPKNGQDAWIEYFFDYKREFQPKEDTDGRIDYHDVSIFTSINKGDQLCLLHPATEGVAGESVTGARIEAKSGRERLLPQGPQTEISHDDPNLLIAAENGCVTLNKTNLVEVQPRLVINGDVDFNTGNVDFVGSLAIGGDVKAGFKVHVVGDLEVGGCVEDAEVDVEGNALVKKGFIGRGKGMIKTAGDLTVKYVHGQNVICGANLYVGGELMHSFTRVSGNVIANSRKGVIMGGRVEAEGNVDTTVLGSTSYTATEVTVGVDFKLLDRLKEIDDELKTVKENQDKVKKALYNFSVLKTKMKGQLSTEHQTLFERLQETSRYYPKYQSELEQEAHRIQQDIARHKEAHVRVHRTLFPGVKVTIGKFARLINEQAENQTLREIRGEIVSGA